MRIGIGYDVHKLGENRPLIIGGAKIPFEKGLVGHSDADVLTHALMDGLLGAMGEPDIGHFFPPDDDKYLNADSLELLAIVKERMDEKGYEIANCDMVIMAEAPKMLPYIPVMKEKIARVLRVDESVIGIKATTTEKLGFVGRGEGVAAEAVVLLEDSRTLRERVEENEREQVRNALLQTDYNTDKAAELLGISRSSLYRRIRKYKLPSVRSKNRKM